LLLFEKQNVHADLTFSTPLMLGGLPLGFGVWQLYRELAPRGWPQVSGTVVTTRIDKQPIRNGYQYVPFIDYKFCYKDQTFTSSRRRAGNYISGQNEDAEAVIARYPVGSSVTVFVNPKSPGKSALEYGTTPLSWIFIVIGLVFSTIFMMAR
jgi:hypothetical protein